MIEQEIPLLEEILGQWKERIGSDYQGYRNHVYRMLHFCFYLSALTLTGPDPPLLTKIDPPGHSP